MHYEWTTAPETALFLWVKHDAKAQISRRNMAGVPEADRRGTFRKSDLQAI